MGVQSHDRKVVVKLVNDGNNRPGIRLHDGSNRHVTRLHDGNNCHDQTTPRRLLLPAPIKPRRASFVFILRTNAFVAFMSTYGL